MMTTAGPIRSIIDEESIMPCNTYSPVYGQPRTIVAYVCKPGPLLIIENIAPISYQRFMTFPMVITYKHELTRPDLLQHVLPTIQERFWRENAKQKDQAMNSRELQTDSLKDILFGPIDKPETKQVSVPDYPAFDTKDSKHPPTISFHWKDTSNFIPYTQFENNIEESDDINLQQFGKRSYSLEECIEMFTSREQLDVNEAW